MGIFLTILHIVVCFTLIGVILLQAGRSQGLTGASFGSGNVQSLFGTQAADFLTKATSIAAIAFLLTSIGLDYLEIRKSKSLFQGMQNDSTLDIDAVRKALEKIEAEKQQENATADVDSLTQDMSAAVSDAASEAGSIMETANSEASQIAESTTSPNSI